MGRRIKVFRMARNFTQQALAEHSGLNRSTIRDLENGKPLNILSLIQVFRSLEMLSRLDDLLPEISPVLALQQAQRKRVKLSKKDIEK
ncbi:MAG: helix-turn-helix transcriptional regulator [Bacteroidales bacterium]|nr:helix-turn-helix transcriptional regulator [Bacteroidales bacterium]